MKKIVIVIFFSFLFNAFLFGQEKNDFSQLKWISEVQIDSEKFHENGTRTCYLNIYGEIPELYVQSIIDQVLTHSSVLRFNLDYGKNFSRCVCEIKNDFTNEDLALAIDEIIDIYYDSKDYLIDKEKLEQEKIKKELETKRYIEKDKKIDKVEFSASSKTDIDEEMYLEDAAQKAEAMAIWERELQPSKLNAAKWEKGGIYEGFSPKDEILEKRSQNTKHFRKDKGEVIGIIGPNGSGKSTLLKIMSEITAPSNGSVNIDGKVASILEVGTGFIPDLSGRKNIYLNARLHGMKKGEVDQKFI